ncbi:MAG: amidohydrolase [bacterium]|nr:amidohydrolase [bacterium]
MYHPPSSRPGTWRQTPFFEIEREPSVTTGGDAMTVAVLELLGR